QLGRCTQRGRWTRSAEWRCMTSPATVAMGRSCRVGRGRLEVRLTIPRVVYQATIRCPTRTAGRDGACRATTQSPWSGAIPPRAPIPRADPYGFEGLRAAFTRHSHLVRPERYAEAWLAAEGYAYEVITDTTLHAEPDLLKHFAALMIVGHSEYWTDAERDGVAAFLADGGQVVSLSGNTLCWRTSFNDDLTVLESRKAVTSDERWLSPGEWG